MKRIAILTALLLGAACAWAQEPKPPQPTPPTPCSIQLAEANLQIAQLKAQIIQLQFQLAQTQYPQVLADQQKAQTELDAAKKAAQPTPAHTGKSEPMPLAPEPKK